MKLRLYDPGATDTELESGVLPAEIFWSNRFPPVVGYALAFAEGGKVYTITDVVFDYRADDPDDPPTIILVVRPKPATLPPPE